MSSTKVRYLIFFQYFGTQYSGVMWTPVTQSVLGVQNYLEMAAQKLRPVGSIKFSISSRTDTGVHAICNTAHVDIERAAGKPPFTETVLVQALNHHLQPESISLNLAAIHEAAQLLLGTHDFSAFRCANSDNAFKSPIKTLLQADITPASCFLTHNLQYRDLQFWDFTFKSKSFLYKQVRRMTGALVAVGRGQLTPQHVKELLETRDPKAFPGSALAPPDGLFLKEVEYDEMDLSTEQILS
ncbi:tRNA pseudouridine synthase-like 1 isoform X5 [Ascaphus truei]|uniref:tRNA pseudouridine synthase-like 1 isoform X5 n=1 Tax=Ascaphus truei TaxID=8439 RepID=UPI003F597AB8